MEDGSAIPVLQNGIQSGMDEADANEWEVDGVEGEVGLRDCFLAFLTCRTDGFWIYQREVCKNASNTHRPFQELILSRETGSMPLRRSAVLVLPLASSCDVDWAIGLSRTAGAGL